MKQRKSQRLSRSNSTFHIEHVKKWNLSGSCPLHFLKGRQWFRINSQARNLESLMHEKEPNRYLTVNKMRPLIDGVVGKLTQCAPDSSAVPISNNPVDLMAADEANYIVNHYNRKFDRETQTKERVRWACVSGTSFFKSFLGCK